MNFIPGVPENYQNVSNVELLAIEWKFTSLDIDRNNSLSKNEYKDLRGLIRKAVKPKRCSRKFIRLCDIDRNSLITKQEWINCLNISNTGKFFLRENHCMCLLAKRTIPVYFFWQALYEQLDILANFFFSQSDIDKISRNWFISVLGNKK